MPTIKFTDTTGLVPEMYYPKPSKTAIPIWFKKLIPEFIPASPKNDGSNKKEHSGKRCVPMLDAMTAGYTIFTTEDILVEKDGEYDFYEWTRRDDTIEFHTYEQMSTYPDLIEGQSVPKWINPWVIKTPPGYSCIFTEPMNNPETPISIFSGIVDTDTYIGPVNFPFMLRDKSFAGLIPAGTPIAQIFPFARAKWNMEIGTITEKEVINTREKLGSLFWDKYKRLFWTKKEFNQSLFESSLQIPRPTHKHFRLRGKELEKPIGKFLRLATRKQKAGVG